MRTESFDSTKGSWLDALIWRMRVRKITGHLPPKVPLAVDLGCGRTAPLLRELLAHGAIERAIGVDLAPDFKAQSNGLEFIQADLNGKLPIASASVDVVFSLAVLEHLTEPGLHLAEVHRILKPSGTLMLTTPSPRGKPVLEFLAFRLGVIDRAEIEDHKTYFDSSMLRTALAQAGFDLDHATVGTFQLGMNNTVVASR